MNELNKLNQRLSTIPILSPNVPMAYGEYLTYIEQIYAIYDLTKQLITITTELTAKVDSIELNFEELQKQIDNNSDQIEQLYSDFNNYKNEIINLMNQRLQQIYNELLVLLQQYQEIYNTNFNEFKNDVNEELDTMNGVIDNIIRMGDINAYDPTTGEMTNLNLVLSNIYGALRQNALTVAEFEALNLTCTGFDVQEVSAYNFDINGKTFVHGA